MLTMHAEPRRDRCAPASATVATCRLCGARLHRSLIDLGCLPLAGRTLATATTAPTYPLHIRMCDECQLVQTSNPAAPVAVAPSPRSVTCVQHAGRYAEAARKRLRLDRGSLVIEIGSNDGSLLRHFQTMGVSVLGVEPEPDAAAAAAQQGVPTEAACFDTETAMQIAVRHGRADLVIANNVLPHVPDLFDFAAGFASILKPNGVLSLQVPHLLSLLQRGQFDLFSHDSYTYLSLQVLERILRSVGLRIFDAERVADDGGSLRVQACHAECPYPARPGLKSVRMLESFGVLDRPDLFTGFSQRVAALCEDIRMFLHIRRQAGRRVAAYGATARCSMMLNVCALTRDQISCVADLDPAKQGQWLPGSLIPIVSVDALLQAPPDDVIILPWTQGAEVAAPLQPLRQRGTQLWTPMPRIARV